MPYYKEPDGTIQWISQKFWQALRQHHPDYTEYIPIDVSDIPEPEKPEKVVEIKRPVIDKTKIEVNSLEKKKHESRATKRRKTNRKI